MEDIDIWRSANQLITSYGDKAAEVAAGKVIEMQRAKDGEGMAVWVSVMLAIRELTKDEVDPGSPIN
ncbi:MAG: hypothetical protein KGJ49_05045 [Alphaproteobacteria bacterium]|nr:hypothetical protein [Alphaproteobacteria bacterium]